MRELGKELETQSICFDVEKAEVAEQASLEPDELAIRAVNHEGEHIFMVVKREALIALLAE